MAALLAVLVACWPLRSDALGLALAPYAHDQSAEGDVHEWQPVKHAVSGLWPMLSRYRGIRYFYVV